MCTTPNSIDSISTLTCTCHDAFTYVFHRVFFPILPRPRFTVIRHHMRSPRVFLASLQKINKSIPLSTTFVIFDCIRCTLRTRYTMSDANAAETWVDYYLFTRSTFDVHPLRHIRWNRLFHWVARCTAATFIEMNTLHGKQLENLLISK